MKLIQLLTFSALLIPFSSQSWAFPRDARVPGGLAQIDLGNSRSSLAPTAFYLGKQVAIAEHNQRWLALVGIPLTAKIGQQTLTVKMPNENKKLYATEHSNSKAIPKDKEINIRFDIVDKDYPEQHITLTNTHQVNPDAQELARIKKEIAEQLAVYSTFSTPTKTFFDLQLPGKGPYASAFGLKRFFNGEQRDPHAGLDIVMPEGAPARVAGDGVVVQIGHYFFNGNTVMVDHSQGLITMYCHLSKIEVKKGQVLHTGDEIGKVGHTGRATGPHLHWGVSMNNVRIDPTLFLPPEQQ